MTSYVLHDTEVRLTGRTASKPGIGGRETQLVEVTPVNEDSDGNWKKWVPLKSLFQINEDLK